MHSPPGIGQFTGDDTAGEAGSDDKKNGFNL